eukprot:jgi/Mesvir1/27438/Mv07226-RA.1
MVKSQTTKEETYACPLDELWSRAGNFGDLSWGGIPIENITTAPEGENGTLVRRITAPDGAVFVEGLLAQGERSYTYNLTSGPPMLEITNYVSTLSASQGADGKSILKFSSSFDVEPEKEDAMIQLLHSIYGMLLGALSQSLTGSS